MFAARALSRAARTAAPRVARPAVTPRVVASRSYAQAAATQSVKPPVALYGVDGTYASALVRSPRLTRAIAPHWLSDEMERPRIGRGCRGWRSEENRGTSICIEGNLELVNRIR